MRTCHCTTTTHSTISHFWALSVRTVFLMILDSTLSQIEIFICFFQLQCWILWLHDLLLAHQPCIYMGTNQTNNWVSACNVYNTKVWCWAYCAIWHMASYWKLEKLASEVINKSTEQPIWPQSVEVASGGKVNDEDSYDDWL